MRSRNLLALVLFLCVIQVAGYWFSGSAASLGDSLAVPQPDTLLYCQAARRIVGGHPFSFSHGELPTTGTSSVLYPFVLAVPYFFGVRGDSLLTAGFLVNAAFYIVFVLAWAFTFCRWFSSRRMAVLASVLLALSGQPALCAMASSDTGLWMCASALFVLGLATGKRWLWGALLALLPWIRPEGFLCLIAVLVAIVLPCFFRRNSVDCGGSRVRDACVWSIGCLSSVGVFAANNLISGATQFSSVAAKGHFAILPFASAVAMSARDAVVIFCQFFMGLATDVPRCLMSFPFLAGICVVVGIAKGDWKRSFDRGGLVCAIMAVLGVALVASSSWQGTNYDRYLAWLMPIGAALVSEGAWRISALNTGRPAKQKYSAFIVPGLLLSFGALSSVAFFALFYQSAARTERFYSFAKECDSAMPANASVGALGYPGAMYGMGDRRLAHVYGIYSRGFHSSGDEVNIYETLKNDSNCRFDYWFLNGAQAFPRLGLATPEDKEYVIGETCLVGPDTFELRKADWKAFDDSRLLSTLQNDTGALVARIDVGYLNEENEHSYSVVDRYNRNNEPSFVISALNGKRVLDGCRIVTGFDRMKVSLQPGKDVTVVMRTFAKLSKSEVLLGPAAGVSFANPLRLNIAVNGVVVDCYEMQLADCGFTDASFTIPGAFITGATCEVAFLGDHGVGGYWFYQ